MDPADKSRDDKFCHGTFTGPVKQQLRPGASAPGINTLNGCGEKACRYLSQQDKETLRAPAENC